MRQVWPRVQWLPAYEPCGNTPRVCLGCGVQTAALFQVKHNQRHGLVAVGEPLAERCRVCGWVFEYETGEIRSAT